MTAGQPARPRWLAAALVAALAYPAAGVLFGALAGGAATASARTLFRLAAFVVSGVVFLAHVFHERRRNGTASRTIALRVALGVALGALLLAAVGPLRMHGVRSGRALAALAVWPALTGLPAFVAAWALAAALAVRERRARAGGPPGAGAA